MRNVIILFIVAIITALIVIFYPRKESIEYSGYQLSAADASDDHDCKQCLVKHQNDKPGLCNCLKNAKCTDEIAANCSGKDDLSACDTCNHEYSKCMVNGTFDDCRKKLCTCLTDAKCDPLLVSQTCAALPPNEGPTSNTCDPADGMWSKDGKLGSPCCQPPHYNLNDSSYKTCANYKEESDPQIRACLESTCKYVDSQSAFFDPSWAPMAKCASSLCCYNMKNPHFAKHGSCSLYIHGEKSVANTPDTAGASTDWRGYIDYVM